MTFALKIVYVDDDPDLDLSQFLGELQIPEFEIDSLEIRFDPSKGYESLLSDSNLTSSNIVIIDSRLFENQTAAHGKFTGEEFKVVLKKLFPFIEVIVISNKERDDSVQVLEKCKHLDPSASKDFYEKTLTPLIKTLGETIKQYQQLAKKLNLNSSWETILKEKIINSINGINHYDELTKEDIDRLIEQFKEWEKMIYERL